MTVTDLYEREIKLLSPADRLQLATLILNGIPPQSLQNYSEEWSEEDIQDFSRAGWEHIHNRLDEDERA